jgi:hypothetical protein
MDGTEAGVAPPQGGGVAVEDSGPEVAQSIPGDGAEQSDSGGGGGSGDGGGGGNSNSAGENDDGHSERDATSVAAGSDIVLSVSPVASPTTIGTPPPHTHTPHPQRTRMHSTRTLTNHNRLLERAA